MTCKVVQPVVHVADCWIYRQQMVTLVSSHDAWMLVGNGWQYDWIILVDHRLKGLFPPLIQLMAEYKVQRSESNIDSEGVLQHGAMPSRPPRKNDTSILSRLSQCVLRPEGSLTAVSHGCV